MYRWIKTISFTCLGILLIAALYMTWQWYGRYNPMYTATVSLDQPTATFKLSSNPTTGYRWQIIPPLPTALVKTKRSYQTDPHAPNMVGVGGIETWQFTISSKAIHAGKPIYINMNYQRPWIKKKSAHHILTLTILTQAHWFDHWLMKLP